MRQKDLHFFAVIFLPFCCISVVDFHQCMVVLCLIVIIVHGSSSVFCLFIVLVQLFVVIFVYLN